MTFILLRARLAPIALTALATAGLIGCGGSGSATPGPMPLPTYTVTPVLHKFSGNEAYQYSITNATQTTAGTSSSVLTPALRKIALKPSGSNFEFLISNQFGSGVSQITETQDYLFAQDSNENLNFVANKRTNPAGTESATAPIEFLPGTFTSAGTVNTTGFLNPTGNYNQNLTTTGTTNVTIGIGTFNGVYVVNDTYTVDQVTFKGTYFYDPHLGTYVSGDETVTDTVNNTITSFHLELTSFNNVTP